MMRSGYRKHSFRNKAERPLLLLFPGCCDDAAASLMRIRKGQARGPPGNASHARGESTSSAALADESPPLPASAEVYTPVEAPPSSSSPALQKLSPTPPVDRPYMNLDEFVSSLARTNCFPDEETYRKEGESSGFDDHFVDTSLRLAISPHPQRIKGGNVVEAPDDGRRQFYETTTTMEIGGSALETGMTSAEAHGESFQATSVPEPTEVEVEAGPPDQTTKSSTESMGRRPRRASRSTGRTREQQPAEEQEEEEDEDDTSDHSSKRTRARKRKRKRSERSSSAQDQSDKKPSKKKPGSSRSGRPKKLKYMKQENTEELGNQCNRSDGKGWTCPLLAKTGYQLCDHHLDKLRCKPGSRSKYNKSKKKKQQQGGGGASTLS